MTTDRVSRQRVRTGKLRGWETVVLQSGTVRVVVLPGKGGDIISIVRRGDQLELLWRSPWGLREHGAMPIGGDSAARLISAYPGGWQSVFPNGGDATSQHGVEWGMHGEVWLAPFDWQSDGSDAVVMSTRLVLSPFRITKRVAVHDDAVVVSERITNDGNEAVDAMWSHHPAFGAPFLSEESTVDSAAHSIIVDDRRRTGSGDLALGVIGTWPYVQGVRGGRIDLRTVPDEGAGVERLAYLGKFTRGWARLQNPRLDAGVELSWDATVFPYAWYWLEAGGTSGFPWYRAGYVLGIEPASTIPGQGLGAAQRRGGNLVRFAPGETRQIEITLQLTGAGATQDGRSG